MNPARKSDERWIVFSGGGTGGHLTQAMAVAECVKACDPQIKIAMLCSSREIDSQVLSGSKLFDMVVPQNVLPLPGKTLRPDKWFNFLLHWNISYKQARRIFRKLRPGCVLGFGGFAAAPMIVCGDRYKIPTALLNPDSVPGKANRGLVKYTSTVFIAYEMSRKYFAGAVSDDEIILSGCPIRSDILGSSDKSVAAEKFGLDGDKIIIGVMGGSLGAKNVNDAVTGACGLFGQQLKNYSVLHISGAGKSAGLQECYDKLGVTAKVLEFCHEMGDFYACCDLVVARGGANCVAELAATKTPSVIMPYPWHADMHQKHNAADLAASGGAVIVDDLDDKRLNSEALGRVLAGLLGDPDKLTQMSAAAGSCGRADAASIVADKILSLMN